MFSVGDIAELENKYSKYIFKKRLRVFLLFTILILIIFAATYFFIEYKNDSKKNKSLSNINVNTTKTIKNSSLKTKKITILEKNDSNISSLTALTLVNDNKTNIASNNSTVNNNIAKIRKTENKETQSMVFHLKPSSDLSFKGSNRGRLTLYMPTIQVEKEKYKSKIIKKLDKNDTISVSTIIKPMIKIQMKDIDSIKYLKDKFNATHDITFALMLCEEYYSRKDYKNSLKWSMIANDIDNGSERSWVWFAKSEYRLNKKKDAVEALKAYLKSNDSATVRSLLHDIITGELND